MDGQASIAELEESARILNARLTTVLTTLSERRVNGALDVISRHDQQMYTWLFDGLQGLRALGTLINDQYPTQQPSGGMGVVVGQYCNLLIYVAGLLEQPPMLFVRRPEDR